MEFSIDESPAVIALGPLFKLTEVHLWDDYGSSGMRELSYFQEPFKFVKCDLDYVKGDFARTNVFCSLPEDMELAKELNELGLPLSFNTNKEKRNGTNSGKRKGTRKNNHQSPVKIDNNLLNSIKVGEESQSPALILHASKILDQNEMLKHDIVEDVNCLSNLSLESGDSMSSTACNSALTNEFDDNGELSDLVFDHSLDRSFGLVKCGLHKTEAIHCTNAMIDDDISAGSCLTSEIADHDKKAVRGEIESTRHQDPLAMDHDADVQLIDLGFEVMQDANDTAYSSLYENTGSSIFDNHQAENFGDWIAYWDDFHMRTYFYNIKTEESTWDPPSGMEHLAFGNIADEPTNIVVEGAELNNDQSEFCRFNEVPDTHLYLAEEYIDDNGLTSQQFDEISGNCPSADNLSGTKTTKKKKKVKKAKSNRKSSISSEELLGVLQEVTPSISKYWCQRYRLFSRFDHGVIMDEEGWFSVTPEVIAKHHAVRCGSGAIVDFFTGVGGNAIQFAQWSKHVIAIDIDPNKIEYARHNAAIYGVDDNIDFIRGDSFSLAPTLKANTVFMSPPWGGPDYSKVKKFDINTMLKPRDGKFLFDVGKRIAPKIVMFLPRNVDINQLAELSLSSTPPWSLEVEKNFLNDKLKAVTAYFFEPSMS